MTHKFSIRTVTLLMAMLLVVAVFSPPVFAQDGPSKDDLAIVDRAIAAMQATNEYASFKLSIQQREETNASVVVPEVMEQDSHELKQLDGNFTIIKGDSPNAAGTITASYNATEGEETLSAYSIEAEVRYVDDMLYTNAQYVESDASAAPLPEGWVLVDDPANFPELESLGLADLLSGIQEDNSDIVKEFAQMRPYVTSVTVKEDEINGVAVEVIFISLGWDGMLQLMNEEEFDPEDPMTQVLADALTGEDDLVTIIIGLDADDTVHGFAFSVDMSIVDLDLRKMDESLPEGATMSLSVSMSETREYSEVNAEFEPATAPE